MQLAIKFNRYTIVTVAICVLSAAIIAGGYFLLSVPQQIEFSRIKNQCAESQSALEQVQLAAQEGTKAKQKKQCEEIGQLVSGFSAQRDAATELVFEIGQIANELRLSEFSSKNQKQNNYSTTNKSKFVSEVWLDVNFKASFEQFMQFMHRLECHNPVVFIEEISFQRRKNIQEHEASLKLSFLAEIGPKNKTVAMTTH